NAPKGSAADIGGDAPAGADDKPLVDAIRVNRPRKKYMAEFRDVVMQVFVKHWKSHWLEYGTAERFHKKSGKSTGATPAYAYMRRAVDEHGESAIRAVTAKARDLIMKAAKKASRNKTVRK